jgi:hypothetical protein
VLLTAFNWREKMVLRLGKKTSKKPISVQPYGDFEYIKKQMDPEKGDFMITLKGPNQTTMTGDEIVNLLQGDRNSKKTINISMLYGSNKSAGFLPSTHHKKKNFSHKRIFGHKSE